MNEKSHFFTIDSFLLFDDRKKKRPIEFCEQIESIKLKKIAGILPSHKRFEDEKKMCDDRVTRRI